MNLRHRLTATAALVAAASPMLLLAPSPATAAPEEGRTSKAPTTQTLAVGSNPADAAISQKLGKAFVVDDGAVTVVSLLTQRTLTTFDTKGYHGQNSLALSRDETKGYISNEQRDVLTVFDTETYKVARTVKSGYGGVDVAYVKTPKGDRVYVLNMKSADPSDPAHNELVAIDPSTDKVVQRTKLPGESESMAVAPGGKTVWVGDASDYPARIRQVSTRTGRIVKTVKIPGAQPNSLTFTPNGKRVWVGSQSGVVVLDATTGRAKKNISAPKIFPGFSAIVDIEFSRTGRDAFVVNAVTDDEDPRGAVADVDTRSYKVKWRVKAGNSPLGSAVDIKRNRMYVPNFDDDTLTTFRVPR